MIERHGEWPDKIIEGSTLNGLNGHLRRHARVKLGIRNQFEFVLIDPNEHDVIGIVSFIIGQPGQRRLALLLHARPV